MADEEFLPKSCRGKPPDAAFPFGNIKGTDGTCSLGLQTNAYFGKERPVRSDRVRLKVAGLLEWLAAQSGEGYDKKVRTLISNVDRRAHMELGIIRKEVEARFYDLCAFEPASGSSVGTLWCAYRENATVQPSDRRPFTVGMFRKRERLDQRH